MEKNIYPIKWEVKSHSYQIADTGDYDGYWEITNGKDSLITKDDYEDIEKDLQELVNLLNNIYPNLTIDRGSEAALDAENKWLKQELEELKGAPKRGPVWVKASIERLLLHKAFWNMPGDCNNNECFFPVRIDGHKYRVGEIFDERQDGASEPIYMFVINGEDYYEKDFHRIEWLDESETAVAPVNPNLKTEAMEHAKIVTNNAEHQLYVAQGYYNALAKIRSEQPVREVEAID